MGTVSSRNFGWDGKWCEPVSFFYCHLPIGESGGVLIQKFCIAKTVSICGDNYLVFFFFFFFFWGGGGYLGTFGRGKGVLSSLNEILVREVLDQSYLKRNPNEGSQFVVDFKLDRGQIDSYESCDHDHKTRVIQNLK